MRILIVDDHEELRTWLKSSLEASLFAVDVAEDGERGSALALANNYDLIILDNLMPGKTGMEVCQDIRRAGKTVPILILSVLSDTDSKVELLNTGADDYLIKPFTFDELRARIRALMRRQPRIEQDVLTVSDLTLDRKTQTVTRGSRQIDLRHKEFMLLEYMMQNAGTVLSREMLVQHVWDTNADLFSNTIESHIVTLRNKLGKPQLIHTVRGSGYRISAPAFAAKSRNS